MSNDFGTVNVRRSERSREIDNLRLHYNRHRESLTSLAADAPSDHLATEYQRLIREIDLALGKLGELEGRIPQDTNPAYKSEPGTRTLVTPPSATASEPSEPAATAPNAVPRIAIIVAAGVVVLAIIGWLLWRASGERPLTPVHERTAQTATVNETAGAPVTPAPKPLPAALGVEPPVHDYGTIRKGTRAVRQFQVTNNADQPVALQVARSACRCLYYEYPTSIAAHAKENITVTIDGAKAKAGPLHETVTVASKKDPSVTATMDVNAVIR